MVRFVSVRVLVVCLGTVGVGAVASAQTVEAGGASEVHVIPSASSGLPSAPNLRREQERLETRRPRALLPLYVGFGALQGLDTHSTLRALDRGAVEANPLMQGVAGHPAALLAIKAAGATAVLVASERMWRRNKTAAVVFMIAANAGMGYVVQHNYRAVR